MTTFAEVQALEAAAVVRGKLARTPKVAVILGSGLSDFSDNLTDAVSIPYDDIPHYPAPTVPGHIGELVAGRIGAVDVITARGRFHHYEGHERDTITLPVRLFAELGVETVIITNAAGCVREDWEVGDLMLITGHLDSTYIASSADPTLVDNEVSYRPTALEIARAAAKETGITLREGTYSWALGSTFETPAEIHSIRSLGGDAVGMSTVPEIEAASFAGLRVIGISCLTNYAAGILDQPLNHDEVLETGQMVKQKFATLVTAIIQRLG